MSKPFCLAIDFVPIFVQVVRANANKLFMFKSFLAFDLENLRGEPLKNLGDSVVVSVKGKQGSLAVYPGEVCKMDANRWIGAGYFHLP